MFERTVTQRDFDRFAALSRDDNPIHCDPAFARTTHFGATVAHGMFLYSLISAALTRRLGRGWRPLSQSLMFPAATYAGETVEVSLEPGEAGHWAVATHVRRDGRPVLTCEGTTQLADLPAATVRAAAAAERPPTGATTHRGLTIGDAVEATRVFTDDDLDEYVALADDPNPWIADRAAALGAGLAGRLIPGPLLSGMFSDLLGTRLPGRGTGWMKQTLVFLRPAHPGEPLVARVEVVRLRPDKDLVNLRSTVTGADDAPVVSGESLVLVRNLAAPFCRPTTRTA
jgi:acyl dehydratase